MPGSAQSTLWQAFRTVRIPQSIINWLVVWNMNGLWLSIQLGMSSSQLTLTPWFFRGVGQPLTRLLLTIINHILTIINHILIVYYRGLGRSTTNQMKNESSRCCSETNRPRTWDFHSFGRHTLCQGSDKSLEPWFLLFWARGSMGFQWESNGNSMEFNGIQWVVDISFQRRLWKNQAVSGLGRWSENITSCYRLPVILNLELISFVFIDDIFIYGWLIQGRDGDWHVCS